jgi:ubiquinone/menaquinone biosynthesis C-methylase UbiE
MSEVFNDQYAFQYDAYSATAPKMYEIAANALLQVDEGIQDGDRVVEVGSGTGNSSIILARSNPELRNLICIEPGGFIHLAAFKLGQRSITLPQDGSVPDIALAYIEEQKAKALEIKDKVHLVSGRVPQLPLATDSADRIYCPESFHWFSFKDEVSPANYQHLSAGVADIARVLHPGGKLIFDSNGHIFDFKDAKLEGRDINDMHYTNHPLYRRFYQSFDRYITSLGITPTQNQTEHRLRHIFNQDLLEQILKSNGFQRSLTQDGDPYLLTLVPVQEKKILESARE